MLDLSGGQSAGADGPHRPDRVVAAGAFSDRSGPAWPTALAFAARVAVSALMMVDQSAVSVAVFALVFGAAVFDATGSYDIAFSMMLAVSLLALIFCKLTRTHHVGINGLAPCLQT